MLALNLSSIVMLMLALLISLTLSAAQSTPPTVRLSAGLIQGYYDTAQDVNRFNNIPFAQPPVNQLRFLPPAVASASFPLSPYPANSTSIIDCIQPRTSDGQEDCLYLSVTAPNPLPASGAGLPVIVYICGGGFQSCYGNDAGSWMRRTQSFIFVSINYRLGIFGFFSLPELSAQQAPISYSGNQGLQDQQAALRWVQANIAAFGGDPSKVTIQGESAGSISICYHLISPKSTGLFRGAIMESGGCEVFVPWGSYLMREQEAYVRQVLNSTDNLCSYAASDAVVGCLLGLPASQLYAMYQASPPERGFTGDVGYWPVLDGVILPDTPTAIFQAQKANNASVLIGTNAGETAMWLLGLGQSYDYNYTQTYVDSLVGYESGGNATVVAFYNADNYQRRYNGSRPSDLDHIIVDATTSEAFHCPARRVAKGMSAASNTVFHYSWNYLQAGDPTAWTGLAAHSRELALVFYGGPAGDEDAVMAAQIQNYWHRFVAWGDVNVQNDTLDGPYAAVYGNYSLPSWPAFAFTAGNDQSLLVQNNSASMQHFAVGVAVHGDQCDDLWDIVVPLPVVERRVTQCQQDQCSTKEWSPNVCVDNYNSTYYCVCDLSRYAPTVNSQACTLVASSNATSSSSSSSSSSTSSYTSTAASNSSSYTSSSSSSWSSSTGEQGESGFTCGLWCYVAIALIVVLAAAVIYMVYRMYTNRNKLKAAAAAASPRTSTGSAVPGISSSTRSTIDDGDEYNVTEQRVTVSSDGSGRVVRKKKTKKIRVNTGSGLNDSLLDDRV